MSALKDAFFTYPDEHSVIAERSGLPLLTIDSTFAHTAREVFCYATMITHRPTCVEIIDHDHDRIVASYLFIPEQTFAKFQESEILIPWSLAA